MAPLMPLPSGAWLHAFELRFLLSAGANSPLKEQESKANQPIYYIPVPDGFFLCANLIIGPTGVPLDYQLPSEFLGAYPLWRVRLPNGGPAVLTARMIPLDNQNREHIKFLREELKPNVTVTTMPTPGYVEVHRLFWSAEGNLILVVPMGEEAFRSEQDFAQTAATRHFRYHSSRSTADLIAPNLLRVAVLEMAEVNKGIDLMKGLPKIINLGLLTMTIEPSNLIAGSNFIASPVKLVCTPNVGGANPRTWEYVTHARFDGFCLSAEVRQISASLQNKNLATPVSGLGNNEEIIMTIPSSPIKLAATLNLRSASAEIVGRFTWLDQR